jgi:Mrp family chromosome partitioning ATPase
VAEQLDGIILLISLGGVDRSLPQESIERIRTASVPLLGIVTNALKAERASDRLTQTAYTYVSYGKDDLQLYNDNTGNTPKYIAKKSTINDRVRKAIQWFDQ